MSRLAPSTVARHYSCRRAVFSWAVSADLISRTACRGIKLPPIPRLKHYRVTAADSERLAAQLSSEQAIMMWTGVATGLRWSEVAGRQVKNFDLDARQVTLTKQLDRKRTLVEPKSAAGGRTFAIPNWLAEDLSALLTRRALTDRNDEALVFVGVKGGPLNHSAWRRRAWAPACERAGLPGLGFHDLRRMNAPQLVAAGADPKVAQTRMGHADPRLTLKLYAEVTEEADRAAAEAVGKRLRPDR
jgi:integrase